MKSIFETKEQYLQFKAAWKKAANTKELQAIHYALYAVIMGKDILKTFTPVTNKTKITCSYNNQPYFSARNALSHLQWIADQAAKGATPRQFEWSIKPHFGDTITLEMMGKLAERIKEANETLSAQDKVIRERLEIKGGW